ncbi:hypothetical protein Tdes44962_MAKER10081, partial [Teratosphaeria destructans]
GPGVEGVRAGGSDGLEGVGVAFPRHGVPEAEEGAVGREIDRPVGVAGDPVAAVRHGVPGVSDEVLGDGEAVSGDAHGGHDELCPGEGAMVLVDVGEPSEFAGHAALEPAVGGVVDVADEHVLGGCRWGRLSEVDEFVCPILVPKEGEATASNATRCRQYGLFRSKRDRRLWYLWYIPMTPTQNVVAIMLSAALPPAWRISMPI